MGQRVFLILLFVSSAFLSKAQQYNFHNYSVGEGLAQSQVFAIAEDNEGYLWMATRGGGLSRFDGISFKNFTTRDGLINDFVLCLLKDKKGNICIGTNAGLSIYNGKKFTSYFPGSDSSAVSVNALAEDKNGRLWMATAKGIYYLEQNKLVKYPVTKNMVSCLLIDSKGNLWFGDDFGLNLADTVKGKPVSYLFRGKDGFTNVLVRALHEMPDGNIMAGTYGGGVFAFNKKRAKAFPLFKPDELKSRIIHDLLQDGQGRWWIATHDAGIYRYDPSDSSLVNISENEGLANNHVSSLFNDSWGNIWIGTSGGGVSKYSGEQFVHYTEKNGLKGDYIYSVFVSSDSSLWMGTNAKGVVRIKGTNVVHYSAENGFVDEKVKCIFQDSYGAMWFGTEGEGLWRFDSSGFVGLKREQGLTGNWVKSIVQDKNGALHIATAGGGVSHIYRPFPENKNNFTIKRSAGDLPDRVNCLFVDKNNTIWAGADAEEGIHSISFSGNYAFIITYRQVDKLTVRAIRQDKNGYLWFATAGKGLLRILPQQRKLKKEEMEYFTTADGLTSDNIYLLETDSEGNLWAGSETGVDKIILNENSNIVSIKHFGKTDGFLGIETCQNSAARSFDGSIWFGTINGLTKYNPQRKTSNASAPRLGFTGINLFYQPLEKTRFKNQRKDWEKISDQWTLHHDENHIGFEFIGIDQRNPSMVKYKWKLEGLDGDWSPVTNKREVTYNNLAPGKYTFKVMAMNEDGVWTEKPLEFFFEIESPFWERWWFKLIMYSAIAVIILSIVLVYTRNVKNRSLRLREQLETEKKLLELEQKSLRLQMNPHFIFHALNSIQGLILENDDKTARLYLTKFSKLMRNILENSREQLISLDREIQTLNDYLALEKFTRNDSFDYEIVTDEEAENEIIMIPPMLLQPFVENSIIHGFNGLNRRGKLEIHFSIKDHYLECRVRDNGVGREKAIQNKMQRDQQHKSMALIVTQERLDTINAAMKKEWGDHHSIVINDLTNENDEPDGTEVIVRIAV